MRSESTYLAAQIVAPTIAAHFARQLQVARENNEPNLAPEPTEKFIETLIDVAFWAGLRREEGHSPRISLALLAPEHTSQPLIFGREPLNATMLAKIAPGTERAGIYVGVWHEAGELYVWGVTREIASLCFVLDVSEPGLLVIKHLRLHGFGKFTNVAVLKGDQIKLVDETSASLPDCPALLSSLLNFSVPTAKADSINVLVQLAVSMRDHGRGGTLIVVPHGSSAWRESVVYPLSYPVEPGFTGLADLMRQPVTERENPLWQESLRRKIETIAGLTAIDGATVITDQYELLAFGVKLGRPEGSPVVEQMVVTEPIIGDVASVIHPSKNGGTRHLSAAQFVQNQQDSLAMVASQDGHYTIFSWAVCDSMVHAHRIDTLLL